MASDLSLSRQFALEAQTRAIDACNDIEELRRMTKSLLAAWHLQSEFSRRWGAEALGLPPVG